LWDEELRGKNQKKTEGEKLLRKRRHDRSHVYLKRKKKRHFKAARKRQTWQPGAGEHF